MVPGDQPALRVQAMATKHKEEVLEPVALYTDEPSTIPHLVLLLPDGKGLEAIGSYSGKQDRGQLASLLSETQLHEALVRKLAELRK